MDTILSFVTSLDPNLRYIIFGLAGAGAVTWAVLFIIFHRRLRSCLKKAFEHIIESPKEEDDSNDSEKAMY